MANQNTTEIKEKIIQTLKEKGPLLPVKIANNINQSILFTSAFLSELLSEKKIKISNLRVGSSPIYYISGQEEQLQKYSDHLKNKEKEAYLLLKEKKFLKDSSQEPAIRVALRAIKDFAIAFKNNSSEELYWRFFTENSENFQLENKEKNNKKENKENSEEKSDQEKGEEKEENKKEEPKEEKEKNIEIFDKKTEKPKQKTLTKKKTTKKKTNSSTKSSKFFNKVKEFLSEKNIEILDIENIGKDELIFRIKENSDTKLLVAYDKKRITEDEFLKANKKAQELGLSYILLSKGEPLKRLTNLIQAISNLSDIQKIE